MKIALVHDWLNGMRGGEKVLEVLCELFPSAPLYTLLCEPQKIDPKILSGRQVHTSWIQRSSFLRKRYRYLLPLMPAAIQGFRMQEYDLVISSSHCVAKGVRLRSDTCHISYCHTPMRYLWDFHEEYFGAATLTKRLFLEPLLDGLRSWDVQTSRHVTHFIANSQHVAERIRRIYARESEIIHPPVDTGYFTPQTIESPPSPSPSPLCDSLASAFNKNRACASAEDGNYFLMVSALVPYKKVELALEVFARIQEPLMIIGTGPQEAALRRRATKNVKFLGWVDQELLRQYYRGCRAVLFPGREDFGIVPLEAQACGKPVIAYAQGGALETIVGHPKGYLPTAGRLLTGTPSGIFFRDQALDSLIEAIETFQEHEGTFDPDRIRQTALAFDKTSCADKMRNFIISKVPQVEQSILHYA